ncbi:hypothetical protein A5653_01925 [Mycobacterium colombiense]|uniref:aldehyde dehydrogenase n=1 Tax=Mycobacterium colombiense TaxID=339268 RepID=UPI0007EEFA53|nr:aldehyde dehydrogenase [Mycobacterium colombiense]OBK68939.1 hypothetical protein A5653_01925 [Mycobacterium colombiense]
MCEFPILLIDGEARAGTDGETFTIEDSSTEAEVATVTLASRRDVDDAVDAARNAFDVGGWSQTTADERAKLLEALGQALLSRSDAIGQTISQENGHPIATSTLIQALSPVALTHYFAQVAREFDFDPAPRTGLEGNPVLVTREPLGVAAAVVPWNVPLAIALLKLAPAIAAGCAVVLKPDPHTALDARFLVEAVNEAGFPPGVVNIVPAGRAVSEYLVTHPGVDKVSLTGSAVTGRRVGALCGELVRPCTLELGGKSAAIVLGDAAVDQVVTGLLPGMTMINGQACVAQSRLLVPASRAAEFVDAFATAFGELRLGNALDPETEIGPLVSAGQRDRVVGYIERGVTDGARIAAGGQATDVDGKGYFVQPTLLTDVHPDCVVAQEEIFGPVVTVLTYDDVDEAVAIANNSQYGLSGSVWTADVDRGVEVARQVHTGTINVNYFAIEVAAPFGGYKSSGLGRENGPEALDAYLQYKSIGVR